MPPHYLSKGVMHSGLSRARLFTPVLTELEGQQGSAGSL